MSAYIVHMISLELSKNSIIILDLIFLRRVKFLNLLNIKLIITMFWMSHTLTAEFLLLYIFYTKYKIIRDFFDWLQEKVENQMYFLSLGFASYFPLEKILKKNFCVEN